MENILEQKPQGKLRGWAFAGLITSLLFMVSVVFLELYYYQMVTLIYQSQLAPADYIGIFLQSNGLFQTSLFVFFIGLFASKKRSSFIKFLLWTMMLLDFYFAMPAITGAVTLFWSYSGNQLLSYLGLYVPQILTGILLVAFILQMRGEKKNATNSIAWVAIIADAFFFVFQIISASQSGAPDFTTVVYSLSGAIAIASMICLAGTILMATASPKAAQAKEKSREMVLDDLVEKIAYEVSRDEEKPEEKQTPDED